MFTFNAFKSISSSEQFTDGAIWCAILNFIQRIQHNKFIKWKTKSNQKENFYTVALKMKFLQKLKHRPLHKLH